MKKVLSFCPILMLCAFISCINAEEKINKMRSDNPFGVLEFLHWNHDWNNYKYGSDDSLGKAVFYMKEAGVGIVRMDFLWQDIEPEPGKFEFDKYDHIVDLLTRNNIEVLGLLNYSVGWASVDGRWNSPPKDNKLFIDYAVKVVRRYKNKVKYWEVWNEPDSVIYWAKQDRLKSYSELLKVTYKAIKEIDPGCKVLNGGLASGPAGVNCLYETGAKDYFDIMNIHIFQSPLQARAENIIISHLEAARKLMNKHGDENKNIWITEIGCPGVKPGVQTKNWWLGDNPDEETQALWVEKAFTNLLKFEYVEKVFWAFFRDTDRHWGDGTDYFGLLRWDFSTKPSYERFKKLTSK